MSVEFMYAYRIIVYAIQFFFVMYTADYMLERKIKNTFLNYGAIAIMVPVLRQTVIIASKLHAGLGGIVTIISYVSMYSVLYRGSKKRIVLFSLSFLGLNIISELFTQIMLYFFLNFRTKDYSDLSVQYMDYAIGYVFALEVLFVLTFPCIFFYKKKYREYRILEVTFLLMLLFYQLISSILFYYSCKEYNGFSATVGMIMVLFSLAIDIYVPQFIEKLKESREAKKRYNELMEQRAKELLHYEKEYQRIEDSRILRHEFANYLQTVQELVGKKENKEATEEMLWAMGERLEKQYE